MSDKSIGEYKMRFGAIAVAMMAKVSHLTTFDHPGVKGLKGLLTRKQVITVYDFLHFVGTHGPEQIGSPTTRAAAIRLLKFLNRLLAELSGIEDICEQAAAEATFPAFLSSLAGQFLEDIGKQREEDGFLRGHAAGRTEGVKIGYEDGFNVGSTTREYEFTINDGRRWTAISAGMEMLKLVANGSKYFSFSLGIKESFFPDSRLYGSLRVSIPITDMAKLVHEHHEVPADVTLKTADSQEPILIDGHAVEGEITLNFDTGNGKLKVMFVAE